MGGRKLSSSMKPTALAAFAGVCLLALAPAHAQIDDLIAPPPSGIVPLPGLPTADPDNPLEPPPAAPSPVINDPARSQTGAGDGEDGIFISKDIDILPEPVRRMRARIMQAARSGDLEQLRPLLGSGAGATRLSFGEPEDDPIAYLQSISGDAEGLEMMAIMLDVFEAGYVRFDADSENELYVWPHFYALPLHELTNAQKVELFKLVTAGDFEDMLSYGAYIFFRAGITPEGRWLFFVAGD